MSTYTPIASVTLSSAQSSVTFSGIPQTYTDLVLVVNSSNTPNNAGGMRFNDDSGNNYSLTRLYGTGSSASSDRASNQNHIYLTIGSTTSNQLTTTQISNYANSSVFKTVLMRISAAPADFVAAQTALWRNTNAITSITFFNPTGGTTFNSGTTFNLYGVANASITNVAKATGGDSVYTDGTYWYHIFRSSGTFTPTQALTADYLVVAGGAGGGSRQHGGGGGAGGMRCTVTATGGGGSLESALSLTAQAYTVTVGAGGAGGSGAGGANNAGVAGSNSVFATITSTGGGAGGAYAIAGGNGGSGGGSGGASGTGGTATSGQGYNGGAFNVVNGPGSGGGGAGAAGANASGTYASGTGGNGGNGVATSISGTSVTYAGGGGGGGTSGGVTSNNFGTGGTGGGGSGNGSSGTANTGSAGGGNSVTNSGEGNGGAGGSGIVIVRYAA